MGVTDWESPGRFRRNWAKSGGIENIQTGHAVSRSSRRVWADSGIDRKFLCDLTHSGSD